MTGCIARMILALGLLTVSTTAYAAEPQPAVNDVISRIAEIQKSIDGVLEPVTGETITLHLLTESIKALSANSPDEAFRLANDHLRTAERALEASTHPSPAAQTAVRDASSLLNSLRDRSAGVDVVRKRLTEEVIKPLAAEHLRKVEALELLMDWLDRTRSPVSRNVQESIHALARAAELP